MNNKTYHIVFSTENPQFVSGKNIDAPDIISAIELFKQNTQYVEIIGVLKKDEQQNFK